MEEVPPCHASLPHHAQPPRLALEILGSGAGGLAGRVSVPGNAQENFLTAVLQVKPCNFIILK